MKLVKIEDVRVGQIRKVTTFNSEQIKFEVLAIIEAAGIGEYAELDTYADFYDAETKKLLDDAEELTFYEDGTFIGFLGITHEIKDRELVEIPRAELEVDDVVVDLEEDDETSFIITAFNSSKRYSSGIGESTFYFPLTRNLKKIGIYGVTHEFVNERLAK